MYIYVLLFVWFVSFGGSELEPRRRVQSQRACSSNAAKEYMRQSQIRTLLMIMCWQWLNNSVGDLRSLTPQPCLCHNLIFITTSTTPPPNFLCKNLTSSRYLTLLSLSLSPTSLTNLNVELLSVKLVFAFQVSTKFSLHESRHVLLSMTSDGMDGMSITFSFEVNLRHLYCLNSSSPLLRSVQ